MKDEAPKDTWSRVSRQLVFSNRWVEIFDDLVIAPGGEQVPYAMVHPRPRAVSILPVRGDEVMLVRQHRYPIDAYSWEIPGGGADEGEELRAAAQRELIEETGLRAGRLFELTSFALWNAFSDARCVVYLATDLTDGQPSPGETESLKLRWMPITEALDWTRDGTIDDAITLIALARYVDDPDRSV
jgi:8-oxo-dGTP pyrophosphatase MutT (NUDIX family)